MRLMDMNRWGRLLFDERDASILYSRIRQEETHLLSISKVIEAIPITLHITDKPALSSAVRSSEFPYNSLHYRIGLNSRMSISALFPVSPIFAALLFLFSTLITQEHLQHR